MLLIAPLQGQTDLSKVQTHMPMSCCEMCRKVSVKALTVHNTRRNNAQYWILSEPQTAQAAVSENRGVPHDPQLCPRQYLVPKDRPHLASSAGNASLIHSSIQRQRLFYRHTPESRVHPWVGLQWGSVPRHSRYHRLGCGPALHAAW